MRKGKGQFCRRSDHHRILDKNVLDPFLKIRKGKGQFCRRSDNHRILDKNVLHPFLKIRKGKGQFCRRSYNHHKIYSVKFWHIRKGKGQFCRRWDDSNMMPHRSHFNWYCPPRKISWFIHSSQVVTLLKEAHITYSKNCWKSKESHAKIVTSHLFCMLWTHVSSQDAFRFTGPCAFGTVQRGQKRQWTRDRSSGFLWGSCWQWSVPEIDCYIFDKK